MSNSVVLTTIGGLLLAALALDAIGKRANLPRATLLVLLGIGAGPSGLGLLPQAGVAMGMALVAANSFPAKSTVIMAIAVGTTVILELIGPLFTRIALRRTGEVKLN